MAKNGVLPRKQLNAKLQQSSDDVIAIVHLLRDWPEIAVNELFGLQVEDIDFGRSEVLVADRNGDLQTRPVTATCRKRLTQIISDRTAGPVVPFSLRVFYVRLQELGLSAGSIREKRRLGPWKAPGYEQHYFSSEAASRLSSTTAYLYLYSRNDKKHPALERAVRIYRSKNGEPPIALDSHGRPADLFDCDDVHAIAKWRDAPDHEGYVLLNDVAIQFRRKKLSHRAIEGWWAQGFVWEAFDLFGVRFEKLHLSGKVDEGRDGRHAKSHRVYLEKAVADNVKTAFAKLNRCLKGKLDISKFHKAIQAKLPDVTLTTVNGWRQYGYCAILDRSLIAEVGPCFGARGGSHRLYVDRSEVSAVVAAALVWPTIAEVATDIGMARDTLLRACGARHSFTLGRDLTDSEIHQNRGANGNGQGDWRMHASLVIELAEARGLPDVADKYRQRLKHRIGQRTAQTVARLVSDSWNVAAGTPTNGNGPTMPSVASKLSATSEQVAPYPPDVVNNYTIHNMNWSGNHHGPLNIENAVVPSDSITGTLMDDQFYDARAIAEASGRNPGSVRAKLSRLRPTLDDRDYIEVANAGPKDPQFRYRWGAVRSAFASD